MWPFSKKTTLKECGIFSGMTDWHSHILPGVDDGFRTMPDSLAMLSEYERLGVKRVWLTPHVMEDYPNTTGQLRERFAELTEAYDGPVELKLASENMLDSLFEERLAARDLLTIGDSGKHLLVETSYFNPPMGMERTMEEIIGAGYQPVLAHPERYVYMDEEFYGRLRRQGVMFQSNLMSFAGAYGQTARKKAEWLLAEGFTDIVGSDVHSLKVFNRMTSETPVADKTMKKLLAAGKPRRFPD